MIGGKETGAGSVPSVTAPDAGWVSERTVAGLPKQIPMGG